MWMPDKTATSFPTRGYAGLQECAAAECVGIRGVFRLLKRDRDVALCRQIVDFVRLHFLDNPDQAGGIREIAMMQGEIESLLMGVVIEMINSIGVDQGRPALDAVNRITLGQQQFGEIRTVLAGNTGNPMLSFST